MNLATYTLQVVSPEVDPISPAAYRERMSDKRVLSNLPAMIESIEEDFTDLLPEGYTARIREWQSEPPRPDRPLPPDYEVSGGPHL